MSKRYIGGLITKSPTVPTTSAAPGIWTLDQALYYIKAGTWPQPPTYIEDVFSTYLYTGNGSTQTITNGIDLAGKGGMVWIKDRNNTGDPKNHYLYDTVRGTSVSLSSNTTSGNLSTSGIQLTAFNNNGFSLGSSSNVNQNTFAHVAWTFREAPKFFDVVTFTANSSGGATFSHSLGGTPGCIMFKRTSGAQSWYVYHRSIPTSLIFLDLTNAAQNAGTWVTTTSTSVTVVDGNLTANENYVAYLFAHDTTSDGIIQCGSFTADANGYANVNLGWEPQWVLYKPTSTTGSWGIADVMRGMPASTTTTGAGNTSARIFANRSDMETAETNYVCNVNSTGFTFHSVSYASSSLIYIAIRRGPMRTPTSGTSVFSPVARTGTGADATMTTGFPVDLTISKTRSSANTSGVFDRLRGALRILSSGSTSAEYASSSPTLSGFDNNTGVTLGADGNAGIINYSGFTYGNWNFRRAPSFFDVVCYTGTGGIQTVSHNLGAVPEFIIGKTRSNSSTGWYCYHSALGNTKAIELQDTAAAYTYQTWANTTPTSSQFYVDGSYGLNISGRTYVAYLFASCPGVSKVGSYTGTGALQTINCGFTTGARFVLIKRTDSTGDWYVWDSARGIVAGNDPYLLLNSAATEVTNTDYIDTDNSGFQISSTAPAAINANGGSFIYLAIS